MSNDILLTRKQAAFSVSTISIVVGIIVSTLSGYFQTKDEAKTAEIRLAVIEKSQVDLKKLIEDNDKEAVRRSERVADKIMQRIGEAEARMTSNTDRMSSRVDTLEAAALSSAKRHIN